VKLGLGLGLAGSFALVALVARADVIEVGPGDDVEAAMAMLAPGDELVLQGGTYTLTERFGVNLSGTASAPIVVRAKDGERPHLTRAGADQNLIDVDMAEYVTFRGIEFSGGSAGIRISGARFFTIEDCEIHDTGDVALRANDTGVVYESMRILRNHIHHTNNTGEGMYLGCNNDGCQFANALIEGNYVHHTNQASVEQGDGIELKEGSYNNVVRDNVIHDTNYPCILTYSTAGNGPPNVIERNLLYNCGDHAIQSAADAVIRNNVILGAGSDGIAMQPHQSGSPSNLVVVHNTVIDADGSALSVRSPTGSVLVANNALYTDGSTALLLNGAVDMVTVSGNVVQGSVQGTSSGFTDGDLAADFVDAMFSGMPPNDVFPAAGGALVGTGDADHVVDDDFNGTARDGAADVGAYRFATGGNPGWTLGPGLKGTAAPGGGDAGSGGSAGSDAGAGAGGGAGASAGAGGRAGGGGRAEAGGGASGRAGGGGAGAGGGAAGGEAPDGGVGAGGRDDSGCSCRIAGAQRGERRAAALWLALAIAVVAGALRRGFRRWGTRALGGSR
jgi:hypothetical protein